MDNRSNSRANTCPEGLTSERLDLLDQEPTMGSLMTELNHSNFANHSGFIPAMGHSNFCRISCDVSVVD